jgi:hypothetical protein
LISITRVSLHGALMGMPEPELIDEILKTLQPRSARKLTQEDARESIENLKGFFLILKEWYDAEKNNNENTDDQC